MTPNGVLDASVRPGRLDSTRLALAFSFSLALHLAVFGTYEVGKWTGLWDILRLAAWMHKAQAAADAQKDQSRNVEIPLVFVDVNPSQATTDAPKDTKYYSNRNSKAANPDADADADAPKITGDQVEVVKAEDVPRANLSKLQPAPPAEREQPAEEARPQTSIAPGELAMVKPAVNLREGQGQAEQNRPRTLKEVRERDQLTGRKMKQEGGVKRMQVSPSFDAKATPFGQYDRDLIDAISQRWFDLLDSSGYAYDRTGKVVVQFRLNYDGRVTDVRIVESTVNTFHDLICQRAIREPAPFGRFPNEMRLMVGDSRILQFAFLY